MKNTASTNSILGREGSSRVVSRRSTRRDRYQAPRREDSAETTPPKHSRPTILVAAFIIAATVAVNAQTNSLPPGHPPIDGGLPKGHPPIEGAGKATQQPATPKWTAPAGWTETKAGSVRRGSWTVGTEPKSADVAVTVFPGEVGGPLANVNRWRGQIGLEPITAEKLAGTQAKLKVDGIESRLNDMVNATAAKRMIVVTVPKGGYSWFFKMTGESSVVATQREAFVKFVESVKF